MHTYIHIIYIYIHAYIKKIYTYVYINVCKHTYIYILATLSMLDGSVAVGDKSKGVPSTRQSKPDIGLELRN